MAVRGVQSLPTAAEETVATEAGARSLGVLLLHCWRQKSADGSVRQKAADSMEGDWLDALLRL